MFKNVDKKNTAVLTAVFIVILVLTCLTPLIGDDFIYCFSDASSKIRPLNLYDIFQNMRAQRNYVSARVVNHFALQWFLMYPKALFNFVNAVVCTLSVIAFSKYFKTENKNRDVVLLLTGIALVWCFMPVFGQIYLWTDGACNYGWTIALMLWVLIPYYRLFMSEDPAPKGFKAVLWLIGSLVFGACSETGSLAGIGIALVLLILSYIMDRKKSAVLTAGLALTCIGYAFLMSAPTIRNNKIGDGASVFSRILGVLSPWMIVAGLVLFAMFAVFAVRGKLTGVLLGIIFFAWALMAMLLSPDGGIAEFVSAWYENLLALFAVYAAVLVIALKRKTELKRVIVSVLFSLAGICTILVAVFGIYFSARQSCYCVILLVLAILILARDFKFGVFPKIALVALAAVFVFCAVLGTADIVSVHNQEKANLQIMEDARKNGEREITLKIYDYRTKYTPLYGVEDLGEEPAECWVNRYKADYYGFDLIYGEMP